jgi:predicted pyridoxine 5'-phosphate oxidase superfamily flavin-nucleotide-binding protein
MFPEKGARTARRKVRETTMGHRFAEIAFTGSVRRMQETMGSRHGYERLEGGPDSVNAALGPDEAAFIAGRDSVYMATVGETGWPYVQHRGGPAGFVRVLDEKTIGFADFRGNRQYVSVGNALANDRVSLFFMDYASRTRLKMLGRIEIIDANHPVLLERLALPTYRAKVERGLLIHVEAFDWNCPQHITPRFTLQEVEAATAPLRQRIADLEARLAATGAPGTGPVAGG